MLCRPLCGNSERRLSRTIRNILRGRKIGRNSQFAALFKWFQTFDSNAPSPSQIDVHICPEAACNLQIAVGGHRSDPLRAGARRSKTSACSDQRAASGLAATTRPDVRGQTGRRPGAAGFSPRGLALRLLARGKAEATRAGLAGVSARGGQRVWRARWGARPGPYRPADVRRRFGRRPAVAPPRPWPRAAA